MFLKYLFYQVVGWVMDMEPLSAQDDFYLFDLPINPLNIPSFMICKRSYKMTPQEFINHGFKSLGRDHRCSHKHYKFFGKYFFKKLNDEEYRKYQKTNVVVVEDVRNDREMIEYALKLKQLEGKNQETCSMFSAVFPNLNEDEIGAMAVGHHSFQDGISSLQTYYAMSDNIKADKAYYPFMERPVPKWYHWVLFYCLIPASWF